ncbi:carcinoembryonic antigen-related cell adhesion molecule 1-like isoform X3 [Trachemys scripta elegans]|uniref:carcinoembryonic antigen-related cell adhesion molecule 1-like isoform X3 n=1 Tax=Trachemys scripta elegans TaxID=31138 RepID=UPI0015544970|nr:carcinoembryonic antigen-related cell adhesion molecule 1-like isoform X3 [Trachemys scripta elegans]
MGRIPHRPGGPWTGILLAASVLGSCLQPAPAQTPVTITPPSPVVGGDVSLAPQPPPQDFTSCFWYRSATVTDPNSLILTYFQYPNPVQNNGPAHTGRETVGPGCALNITGLTLNDTGNYTVQIQIPTAANPILSTVVLRVSEKFAKPTVTPGQTQVPENGTLTLTCNTSPHADTVLWLQNGSYLTPNTRLELSSENRTLTVLNFTWGDTGTYQCEVGNPVSTERSEPSTVTLACSPPDAPRPGAHSSLSTGAVAGIVIGSLAGAALVGVGVYFLYSRCRNKTPRENEAPVLVYENLPPTAWAGPVAQPGSPPDLSPTYQTLQPRQPDVYEELKK